VFYIYASAQQIEIFERFQKQYINDLQDLEYTQILKLFLDINSR
jgi:hypothetical protein